MVKAFKFRLNPTKEQEEMLEKHFGFFRWVYNWGLNRKKETYQSQGHSMTSFDLSKELTQMSSTEEYAWIKEYPFQIRQTSLRTLDKAFEQFMRKKVNFLKYKNKKNKQSCSYCLKVSIKENMIRIPKIGWLHFYKHRDLEGEIKTVTITRNTSGDYDVIVFCEISYSVIQKKDVRKETSVGIDLGIKHLAVTSDGQVFENQKYLEKSLNRLKMEARKYARCQKGSKRSEKQKVALSKLTQKVANQRRDYLHKFTTEMVNRYETIIVEDLDVSRMLKNRHLSRSLSDASFAECIKMLKYKCEWNGVNFVKIGRFEPSSKRCHCCGNINNDLKLSDRIWSCPSCGTTLDRDYNAALNIRDYGLGVQPSDAKIVHKNTSCLRTEKTDLSTTELFQSNVIANSIHIN